MNKEGTLPIRCKDPELQMLRIHLQTEIQRVLVKHGCNFSEVSAIVTQYLGTSAAYDEITHAVYVALKQSRFKGRANIDDLVVEVWEELKDLQ